MLSDYLQRAGGSCKLWKTKDQLMRACCTRLKTIVITRTKSRGLLNRFQADSQIDPHPSGYREYQMNLELAPPISAWAQPTQGDNRPTSRFKTHFLADLCFLEGTERMGHKSGTILSHHNLTEVYQTECSTHQGTINLIESSNSH